MTDKEMYAHLVSIRNTELEVLWSRYNILVALNGGVVALFVALERDVVLPHAAWLLNGVGFVLAAVWGGFVTVGYQWVDFWSNQLEALEESDTWTHPRRPFTEGFTQISRVPGRVTLRKLACALPGLFVLFWIVVAALQAVMRVRI